MPKLPWAINNLYSSTTRFQMKSQKLNTEWLNDGALIYGFMIATHKKEIKKLEKELKDYIKSIRAKKK